MWAISCISSNPIKFQSDAAWESSQSASQWELMASGKVAHDRLSLHAKKIGNASERVNGGSCSSLGPCQQLGEKYLQNHRRTHCNQPDPQITCQTDCSGHRKIRSDVSVFLQCPLTSGGAANSLVEWSREKKTISHVFWRRFKPSPSLLYMSGQGLRKAVEHRVLCHNSVCGCSPLHQLIWTARSFPSRTY